jgi:hypothetical protein
MNRRYRLLLFCLPILLLVVTAQPASATGVLLTKGEWIFNVDGVVFDNLGNFSSLTTLPSTYADPTGGSFQFGGDSPDTGGTVTLTLPSGTHNVVAYFDEEFHANPSFGSTQPGFNNEYAVVNPTGAPTPTGLTWQADDAGGLSGVSGSILDINDFDGCGFGEATGTAGCTANHTIQGANFLDDTNYVDSSNPNDVAVALGWTVSGPSVLTFTLSTGVPSGFFIEQVDATNSANQFFFSTTATSTSVPEPGTAFLLMVGLGVVGVSSRLKTRIS